MTNKIRFISKQDYDPELALKLGSMMTEELLSLLEQAFPLIKPAPGIDHDSIMYNSGSAEVPHVLRTYHQAYLDEVMEENGPKNTKAKYVSRRT